MNVLEQSGIYIVVNTVNGKVYVGKTKDKLRIRWQQHVALARRGSKFPFHCAIRKYGPEVFQLHLLSSVPISPGSPEEVYFIARYRATESRHGYNLALGGDAPSRIWTEEQRLEQSRKFKECNPMSDLVVRSKMVAALTGRELSKTQCQAISAYMHRNNPSMRPDVKIQRSKFLSENNPSSKVGNRKASSERLSALQKQPGYVHPMDKIENRKKASDRAKGTIWIHRGAERKHIRPREFESYQVAGWVRGLGTRRL